MLSPSLSRMGRREFITRSARMVAALVFYDNIVRPLVQPPIKRALADQNTPLRFGATFSPLKAWYMDLDFKQAFKELLTLDLDFIRLGSYWNKIEQKKDDISDFGELDWLLNEVEKQGRTEVILTIGVKAPVYPEFQFPAWLLRGDGNIQGRYRDRRSTIQRTWLALCQSSDGAVRKRKRGEVHPG